MHCLKIKTSETFLKADSYYLQKTTFFIFDRDAALFMLDPSFYEFLVPMPYCNKGAAAGTRGKIHKKQ